MRQSLRIMPRIFALLLLVAAMVACSRGAEPELERATDTTPETVITNEEPVPLELLPPEQPPWDESYELPLNEPSETPTDQPHEDPTDQPERELA